MSQIQHNSGKTPQVQTHTPWTATAEQVSQMVKNSERRISQQVGENNDKATVGRAKEYEGLLGLVTQMQQEITYLQGQVKKYEDDVKKEAKESKTPKKIQ
jgi:uncharacterized protein YlxW (UPF0749 family)